MPDPKQLDAARAALHELADEKLARLVAGNELQTLDEQALVILKHLFPEPPVDASTTHP